MRSGRWARVWLTGVIATLMALSLAPVGASSANISKSYKADTKIADGSIVSLKPSKSGYVEPANVDNSSELLGVAVAGNDSLIAVNSKSGAVQVATTGNATTLVSTLNGNIKVGDQVAVSPFNGVGMKALPGSKVIGLAQTSFNDHTPGAATETVKTKSGASRQVKVGFLRLDIHISTGGTAGLIQINSLQRFAQNITGRTVPTSRVIISLAVAIIAMLALVTLVYASIYGSIVSIGRNPLAKYAVFRTLGSVLGLALLTTVISGVAIFFLLR